MVNFKPLRYNTGEGRVTIKIEDESGRNLENWKIMMSDLGTWFRVMEEKFGDQIDPKSKKTKTIDHDLDWLR